ncbi:MAG TPA: DNA cytosine methyltransferase [Anaerolineae bacterium]|nr:DNA cytosine methyltransferase [Anaerolineae bacterium]
MGRVPEMRAQVAQVSGYRDALDAAWARHLAPRRAGAPTVASTFAGCGGSSLGYSMAGFRELAASEWDADARASFGLNFPGVPVLGGDIRELSAGELMEAAGASPGELDVLDGSPPCQGFSTAGKRELGDMRNQLYNEFARLLEGVRPRAFVMENVWGMVKGKMKLVFADCMRKLKAAGYDVRCARLNAMWFGVPQSRERLVFVGVREGLGARPRHPRPTVGRPLTVLEAIGDLFGEGKRKIVPHGGGWWKGTEWDVDVPLPAALATRAPTLWIANQGRDGKALHVSSGAAPMRLKPADGPMPAIGIREGYIGTPALGDRYGAAWGDVPPGGNAGDVLGRGQNSCVKPHPGRPSMTLPAMQGRHGFATVVHWAEKRPLTVAEAKRIQSFPDQFRLAGGYTSGWRQVGNAVPPLMMEAVALCVAATLAEADGHADQAGAGGEAR